MTNISIEQALNVLEKHGYQIVNLWHIDDVKQNYNCTDEEAFEILENALENNYIMESIFDVIDMEAKEMGFEKNR